MSTQYPVLDNRPINKWKVTELREELKRRNLAVKGLKDELVRRLDESIRKEMESLEAEESKGSDYESEPVLKSCDSNLDPDCVQIVDDARKQGVSEADDTVAKVETSEADVAVAKVETNEADVTVAKVESNDCPDNKEEAKTIGETTTGDSDNLTVGDSGAPLETITSVDVNKDIPIEMASTEVVAEKKVEEDEVVKSLETKTYSSEEVTTASDKIDPKKEDAESDLSHPSTQVHEVIPSLGSQVKSDSIPSDTLPINVTKELNDDLNADNVHLEQENVRPEMVTPSSNKDPSDVGVDHPMDDKMPSESHGLVGGIDDDKSSNVKFSMKNENADRSLDDVSTIKHNLDNKADSTELPEVMSKDGNLNQEKESSEEEKPDVAAPTQFQDGESADAGFSKITDTDMADGENLEKINLDQSSPDDSMDEDIVEAKNIDSEQISSRVSEKNKEPQTKELELDNIHSDGDKNKTLDAPEKRKFQDEATPENKEPVKRQRKWNYDSIKASSETRNSSVSLRISRPSLGGSDTTNDVDTPKERIVPESSKTPTDSLRIDNFVRPFTLKAVQELLGQTGKVCSFWMDHIKTHCYVTFSSVEEAIATRNAVYNLKWPTYGGRLLDADFVDPQDVKSRLEGPPKPTAPPVSVTPTQSPAQPPARQLVSPREQPERPHPLSRQPLIPKERPARVPSPDKTPAPIVTLDDLFRKTKTTPRIYYLPLTDEQVTAKVNGQQRNK